MRSKAAERHYGWVVAYSEAIEGVAPPKGFKLALMGHQIGLRRRQFAGECFVAKSRRVYRKAELTRRDVREGEFSVVPGHNLSREGFIIGRQPYDSTGSHGPGLIQDCS